MKYIWTIFFGALLFAKVGVCSENYNPYVQPGYLNDKGEVYLKVFAGPNRGRVNTKNFGSYRTTWGYAAGAALGFRANSLLSLEGEFSYRSNTFGDIRLGPNEFTFKPDIQQYCGFGNVLVNLPLNPYFAPYVGAGIGYRHTTPGYNFDQRDDRSLRTFIDTANEWGVYQAIGGVNILLARHFSMSVDYRYMDGWTNTSFSNHTVNLGAKVSF